MKRRAGAAAHRFLVEGRAEGGGGGRAPCVGPRDHRSEGAPVVIEREQAVPERGDPHRVHRRPAAGLGEALVDRGGDGVDELVGIELDGAVGAGVRRVLDAAVVTDGTRVLVEGDRPGRAGAHVDREDAHRTI